ncbi:uncharacterized protein LY79DRAFT_310046 [Colletotrichum navitas]|uniref:Secreted protein n=1 Tax=Colletotrichum navitas TaxID=681940 RepID=A0AAD8PUH3_9PEZI|nr:uncharacterized protein LY79DRAFT_310046 [Colletotrichum navitas]KAK1580319.1 hypothetical protein LY79DRAFT_310046 [Colletotrichum navitas]
MAWLIAPYIIILGLRVRLDYAATAAAWLAATQGARLSDLTGHFRLICRPTTTTVRIARQARVSGHKLHRQKSSCPEVYNLFPSRSSSAVREFYMRQGGHRMDAGRVEYEQGSTRRLFACRWQKYDEVIFSAHRCFAAFVWASAASPTPCPSVWVGHLRCDRACRPHS